MFVKCVEAMKSKCYVGLTLTLINTSNIGAKGTAWIVGVRQTIYQKQNGN